ncbi:MAG: flavodoxin family protein [Firmicutes bacterium]|nr:flavodoxin family protein [Bacillota bacterium]
MPTILAVSSSPRRNGNSELLLQSFTRGLAEEGCESNTIRLNSLKIRPCQACDRCAATGECIVKDDMQGLYPQVASASALVIATPIYFGSVSAQLKLFIDRFQCWWNAKYVLNSPKVSQNEKRPGFFISVGGLKNEKHHANALDVVKVFFHIINFHYDNCLCFQDIDQKGAIKSHPDALEKAYEAGRRFARENLFNGTRE